MSDEIRTRSAGGDGIATPVGEARIVFLDVDGTMVDHEGRLASSVIDAVRSARARGHMVLLSTGRSRAEIPADIIEIGFDGVITAGGGYVEYRGELLVKRVMTTEQVQRLMNFLRTEGIAFMLQGLSCSFASLGMSELLDPASRVAMDDEQGILFLPRDSGAPNDISKVTFFGDHQGAFEAVFEMFAAEFRVITGTIPSLGSSGGEIFLRGADKGAAVRDLLDILDIRTSSAIAIGDSVNDLEMLTFVGTGIAMGNAADAVKQIATEVTASVDDDGVWKAFRAHQLI